MEQTRTIYEKRGRVGVVRFNRPEALNAVDTQTLDDMARIFAAMDADTDIRCVILTGGEARAFSAGGDIREEYEKDVLTACKYIKDGRAVLSAIEGFRAPVIAAVNGYCLGGGIEFATACDMRIAADDAKFGTPEVVLGLLPGWGGSQRLPRMIGMSKAKELMFLGERYTARQALDMGLVDRVAPAESLMAEALALAEKIAAMPPMAVRYIKSLVNEGMQCDLQRAQQMEGAMAAHLFATRDSKEACMAFLENRPHGEFIGG